MKDLVRYVSAIFSCNATVLAPMPKDERVRRMEAQISELQCLLTDMEERLEVTDFRHPAPETGAAQQAG
jgi:hypothetical protein